jgi:hypothetical protein
MSRVDELLAAAPPTPQQLTDAFWQACHGGQRRMAEHLLALGADLNGTPSWADDTPLDAAERGYWAPGARDLAAGSGRQEVIQSRHESGR